MTNTASETEALLQQIEAAFSEVLFDAGMACSLYQANAWDDYETCDRSRDHQGPWQTLPVAQLNDCQWALPHLDAPGLHYYLPALMSHYLRTGESKHQHIHDSLEQTLVPSEGQLRDYQKERFAPLTLAQRRAILAFLLHGGLEGVEAWQRATESDEGWFNRFNPG